MTAAFSPNWFKYRRLSEMPQQTVRPAAQPVVIGSIQFDGIARGALPIDLPVEQPTKLGGGVTAKRHKATSS